MTTVRKIVEMAKGSDAVVIAFLLKPKDANTDEQAYYLTNFLETLAFNCQALELTCEVMKSHIDTEEGMTASIFFPKEITPEIIGKDTPSYIQ